jgi:alkanesulfonate monooxygenase SsuD/methylene tetrahydromethanopterin reductase-like flavin-dependent oxidoreductase (luciferase family)
VDEISDGRLILGIGAGYHEPEYRAFGYPYDYRFSRFEEALRIIHGLLHNGHVDVEGRFWQARECELRPRGPRSGGASGTIPLMLGTTGEKMLRLTARYADIWNTWNVFDDSRPSAVAADRAKVDAACAAEGRDPATLQRSVTVLVDTLNRRAGPEGLAGFLSGSILAQSRSYGRNVETLHPVGGTPEEVASTLRAFAAEGITHLQVYLTPNTLQGIEAFAPVLERLGKAE